jgi:hypothetical protein
MFGVLCISSGLRFHPSSFPVPRWTFDVRRSLHFLRFQVSSLILPRSPFPVGRWTFSAFPQVSGFIPHPSLFPVPRSLRLWPTAAAGAPWAAFCFPLSALRSLLSALRSPLSALRFPGHEPPVPGLSQRLFSHTAGISTSFALFCSTRLEICVSIGKIRDS